MQQGLLLPRETGSSVHRVHFSVLLAEAHRHAGQCEEGLRLLAEAEAEMEKTDERFYEAELHRLKGELVLQSGVRSPQFRGKKGSKVNVQNAKSKKTDPQPLPPSTQEAEACFLEAIMITRKQQVKSLELRAVISLARLWQQQGEGKKAHRLLAETYGWFTEGFDTKDLQEAKALLENLA